MSISRFIQSILFIGLFTTTIFAKIWIVDNNPNPVGDFTTLSAAHGAASSGDTIYVYPSLTAYAAITLTKQLYIFGPGFDLGLYGGQASTTVASIAGPMNFNNGSQGSVLEGFDGQFIIVITTSNITIKRNDLSRVNIQGSQVQILQNEIVNNSEPEAIFVGNGYGDIVIANNKIIHQSPFYNRDCIAIDAGAQSYATIINNVLKTTYTSSFALQNLTSSSIVINNIVIQGDVSGDAVFQYNMGNSNQFPTGNGNINNVNMIDVFDDPTSFETGWHLKPGSPAIGAGQNGTDMGVYGGDAPYVDGGFPGIPSVYFIDAEVIGGPGNDLNVIFKAKSNKD
jgi:hypothetical protein